MGVSKDAELLAVVLIEVVQVVLEVVHTFYVKTDLHARWKGNGL